MSSRLRPSLALPSVGFVACPAAIPVPTFRPAGTIRTCLWLCGLACLAASSRGQAVDLLLVAEGPSLQVLAADLKEARSETEGAWTIRTGQLGNKRVALACTEGDPLNAVAATTLAIRRHPPRLVLTFGPARAHDPALHPGELVLSGRFAAFDGMFTAVRKAGEGTDAVHWQPLPHLALDPGEEKEHPQPTFPADAAALAVARKLAWPKGVATGVLGSASQVNRESDRVAALRRVWGTSCEDNESAHVAGCANFLGVPAFGLRVIGGTPAEAALAARQFVEAWP